MAILVKHVRLKIRNLQVFERIQCFAKTVSGDYLTPLNGDTLTGRFILYLGDKALEEDNSTRKYDLISSIKSQPIILNGLKTDQLILAIQSLNDQGVVSNNHDFRRLLILLDNECCQRVYKLDVTSLLNLLHTFIKVIPNRIRESQYFNIALRELVESSDNLNKKELVQLIFSIGFLKKSLLASNMLMKCLKLLSSDYINSLTKEDLCIICNSTFKTSTKIRNVPLLDKIKLYVNDNLFLLNDPAVFVTLIKTLRHNRYQDEDLLATLKCAMFFNQTIENYSFTAMCHILALYSDYLYYDEHILEIFSNRCLNQLRNSKFLTSREYLDQPRSKDIKRFLWALSNLNHKLSREDIIDVIVPQIMDRINAGEFKSDPGMLFDIFLYLWMMHYKDTEMIRKHLTQENVQLLKAKKSPSLKSLNLLLTCIYYEDPELYKSLKIRLEYTDKYNATIQLKKRPVLKKIVDNFKAIAPVHSIDRHEVGCQVPYINILGITGFQKKIYKTVYIEILDDYTCLKNTDNTPTGLMQLKLRILDKLDEGVVVIENRDIEDCTILEIKDILKDEISLVC